MSRQREVALSLGIQGPYPGLRPYQRRESLIFFGRERQIDQMQEKLRTVRFLGVVGSSGCGKSSLVRAGLFPALDSGFLVTRDLPWAARWPTWSASRWFVADMQPRNHPFRGLAQGLLQSGLLGERWDAADAANVPALAARLQSGPGQLLRLWEQAQGEPAGNLLILVDQFEELFRFQDTQHAGLAQAFVSSLLDLAAQPVWPVYVAITMRSDFLGDCALFPGLPEVLNAGQFLVSRLLPRDIQAAIEGPARIFDVDSDPLLVTRLLNDVGTDSDQLPLLQHALKRTWDLAAGNPSRMDLQVRRSGTDLQVHQSRMDLQVRRSEMDLQVRRNEPDCPDGPGGPSYTRRAACPPETDSDANGETYDGKRLPTLLTLVEYDRPEIGGVAQALDHHAEEVFGRLAGVDDTDGDKRVARLLFQCLTTRDASRRDVRRPTPIEVVAEVAEVPVDRVIAVVEAFRHPDCCFLTPPAPSSLAADTWLDISHESLLRQWQRLRGWVQAEAVSADELQRLVRDARSWDAGDRGRLQQPELGVLLRWRDRQKPTAAWAARHVQPAEFALVDRYLEESRSREERERQEKEAARQQELEREREISRRQRKLTRIALAVAAAALISLTIAGFLSIQLVRSSRRQTEVLVKATVTAPDEHFPELVEDLRAYRAGALAPLREILANEDLSASQRGNAALALATFGDSVNAARPVLALAEDPSGRTKFIHGYPRFHGDLTEAAKALQAAKADPAAADFRSGLCAALGLILWDEIGGEEQVALRNTLVELYTDAPDGGTHSAAWFALKHWGQETAIPADFAVLKPSSLRPTDDRGWLVNSRGMTMIRIPKGSFMMGDDSSQAASNEKPRHKVTLTKDFFLCDREVTVGQFKEFVQRVADLPNSTDAEKAIAKSWKGEEKEKSPEDDCPVQMVSWFQAVAFCNWLSRYEGLTPCYQIRPDSGSNWKCDLAVDAGGYRLPSEAEWEYACRAVSHKQYSFGDDDRLLAEYGYYYNNSTGRTWPGGGKLPNGWGLFDMHGNVWEWCHDWYAAYTDLPVADPFVSDEGSLRVHRGGSWYYAAGDCRSAYRGGHGPSDRDDDLGFRVARSSVQSRPEAQ
ncbi:MAG: SUMF1/EgtB/PvdO family nonheme iron enzyme [Planctomycetota bacterium]|nr:SUMF1/EgtB/PvdO family nonheme iron enzyme [Planctomycetota bacterium]